MDIAGIVNWFTNHWADIIQIYVGIVGVASIIVKLTPGISDDNVLLGIIKFIGKYLALNVSRADKINPPA